MYLLIVYGHFNHTVTRTSSSSHQTCDATLISLSLSVLVMIFVSMKNNAIVVTVFYYIKILKVPEVTKACCICTSCIVTICNCVEVFVLFIFVVNFLICSVMYSCEALMQLPDSCRIKLVVNKQITLLLEHSPVLKWRKLNLKGLLSP